MTKPLTCVAALVCYEMGYYELDDPVRMCDLYRWEPAATPLLLLLVYRYDCESDLTLYTQVPTRV